MQLNNSNNKAKKPRVGIFGITGCMGCQLSFLYQEGFLEMLEKIELVSFPQVEEHFRIGEYDIVFLEGTVVDKKDLKIVKELREKTKLLVALGSCATDGNIPCIKNFLDKEMVERAVYKTTGHMGLVRPVPIDKHVRVDYYIRGCPADRAEITQFIKDMLVGKEFKLYEKSVCHECTLQENMCLLEDGKDCLGPVTFGNCSVMCPHYGFACIGCRGPYTDSNFEKFFKILHTKGFSQDYIDKIMNKFAGLGFREMVEKSRAKEEKGIPGGMVCPPIKK